MGHFKGPSEQTLTVKQKKEPSYKNYKKYIHKITSIMNRNVKPISLYPNNKSIHSLFTFKNLAPTFKVNEKVYKLFDPFERSSFLHKQSIQLG